MEKAQGSGNHVKIFLLIAIFLLSAFALQAQTMGDVDSNGTVNIVDALRIAQYYIGMPVGNFNTAVADVNCDSKIDIVDALLVARFYIGIVTGFTCGTTATPGPTLDPNPSFAPDQSVFTDEELLSAAYATSYKYPAGCYFENTVNKSLYHVNTVSFGQDGGWFELATNSRDEAYSWATLTNERSSVVRNFTGERATNLFFEFSYLDPSFPDQAFLARAFKLSSIDRSMYDRLNKGPTIARLNTKPLSIAAAKECVEYFWLYDNYNIGGRAILSSFGNEDTSSVTINMYEISVVFGDWGLSDSITLIKSVYTANKSTGDINLAKTSVRTIAGQQR
jgi:hypothetical protein